MQRCQVSRSYKYEYRAANRMFQAYPLYVHQWHIQYIDSIPIYSYISGLQRFTSFDSKSPPLYLSTCLLPGPFPELYYQFPLSRPSSFRPRFLFFFFLGGSNLGFFFGIRFCGILCTCPDHISCWVLMSFIMSCFMSMMSYCVVWYSVSSGFSGRPSPVLHFCSCECFFF